MEGTKIRWSDHTWNAMTGCSEISPGCDHCYAKTIAEKFRGTAFPNGFEPTFKPQKLGDAARLLRKHGPTRIFVNSMSDVHHETWTWDQIAAIYDAALATPEHDYLVLTKRPDRMARFFLGDQAQRVGDGRKAPKILHAGAPDSPADVDERHGYLMSRGMTELPACIWLGTTIESQRYAYRIDWLGQIPVPVHFVSAEPLIEPLELAPDRIHLVQWVIAGGESGPGYRPCPHEWGYTLRDECDEAGVAFYWKQSAAPRTEMGIELDGRLHEEYPRSHPAVRTDPNEPVGRFVDEPEAVTA